MQTLYTDHATISDKHPKRMMPPKNIDSTSNYKAAAYASINKKQQTNDIAIA